MGRPADIASLGDGEDLWLYSYGSPTTFCGMTVTELAAWLKDNGMPPGKRVITLKGCRTQRLCLKPAGAAEQHDGVPGDVRTGSGTGPQPPTTTTTTAKRKPKRIIDSGEESESAMETDSTEPVPTTVPQQTSTPRQSTDTMDTT